MHLGMTLHMAPELRMTIGYKLDLSQKIEIKMNLIQAFHDTQMKLRYECGGFNRGLGCGYTLSAEELLKGFTSNPSDTSTVCPKCKKRFQPILKFTIGTGASGDGEIYFMCSDQAKFRLEARGDAFSQLEPDEIRKKEPAMFHSLLFHFGNLKNAFLKIGIDYSAMEKKDWESRVRPFLGEAPDSLIAEVAGVKVSEVRNLRKKLKVPPFKPGKEVS
jgi:hypothetical protein